LRRTRRGADVGVGCLQGLGPHKRPGPGKQEWACGTPFDRSRALALAALAAFMVLPVWLVGRPERGAPAPVSGCGYTFGPTASSALRHGVLLVRPQPANPAQQCTVSVSFTAHRPNAGARTRTSTTTAARHRERLVVRAPAAVLVVGWPASTAPTGLPGSLTVTAAGQSTPPRSECRRAAATGATHSSLRPQNAHSSASSPSPDGEQRRLLHDRSGRNITSAGNAPAMAPTRQSPSHRWWHRERPGTNGRGGRADGACSRTAPRVLRSLGGVHLNAPIVGMGHASGMVLARRRDAGSSPSVMPVLYVPIGGTALTPRSWLAPHPSGHGYWLVGADGGCSLGDAAFAGRSGASLSTRASSGSPPAPWGLLAGGCDGGVSPSAACPSRARWAPSHSTHRSPAWPSPRRGTAIGWSARTGDLHLRRRRFSGRTRSRPGRNRRLRRSGVPILRSAVRPPAGSHTESHARRDPRLKARVCPSSRETTAGRRGEHVGVERGRSAYNCPAPRQRRRVTGDRHVSGAGTKKTPSHSAASPLIARTRVAGNELGKRAVALSIGLELVSLGGHRPSSELFEHTGRGTEDTLTARTVV